MENKLFKSKKIINDTFIFSIASVVLGLLVGAIALILSGHNPITVYSALIEGIIGKPKYIAWTIIRGTPLILTGLSIAFAYKTGLFNIGAEGQFIIGALVAVLVGAGVDLPAFIHIPLTLISDALAGALWGGISGWLKARFGINEVISNIMLNWIAFYFSNFILMTTSENVMISLSDRKYCYFALPCRRKMPSGGVFELSFYYGS